jgi:predicted dienelactone hydrolase
VVAASPAVGFIFGKAGLAQVTARVQLWRGEDDPVLPNPYYAEAVREDLPPPPRGGAGGRGPAPPPRRCTSSRM